jgi:hypothetical protein
MEWAGPGAETGGSICGPVCAGIGAGIGGIMDALLLLGLFGGGGQADLSSIAHTRITLQPDPNLDLRGPNWSEAQFPVEDTTPTGTLFGSGRTGRFVFSLAPTPSIAQQGVSKILGVASRSFGLVFGIVFGAKRKDVRLMIADRYMFERIGANVIDQKPNARERI